VTSTNVALSVFLRLAGAGSKFILFFYLARHISPESLGLLGIIFAVLAIGVQLTGAEVHYINSRDIASGSKESAAAIIRAQLILHCISYFLALPLLALAFHAGALPWTYFILVALLLISEHIGQELIRFLQFTLRPVLGALVIFVRSGLWVFFLIYLVEAQGLALTPLTILQVWFFFSSLAVLLGCYLVRDYLLARTVKWLFSPHWVIETLSKAAPFLITAGCFTIAQHLDRFVLNFQIGQASVGIFFFMASMASALHILVTFAVGVFYGPLAIRAFRKEGLEEYQQIKRVFIRKTIAYGVAGFILGVILMAPALSLIGREDYLQYEHVFYLMLISNAVMLGSDITNLDLYVRGMDHEIMLAAISGLVATLLIQSVCIWAWGITGAGIGAIFSAAFSWYLRLHFYRKTIDRFPLLLSIPR
jgi:O-antigen/teichoic acid export membrane protein